jgi:hypothetical protein
MLGRYLTSLIVYLMLLLLGFAGLFLLFVPEPPVVHDLAYDRPRVGGHFHEIEPLLFGELEGFFHRHDTDLGIRRRPQVEPERVGFFR